MSPTNTTEVKKPEPFKPSSIPENEFHLGITIAGAVSAGCYVGGAMDYLFEALDLWERAKKGAIEIPGFAKEDIPGHKVIIDAIGGASAGGITSVMSALHLLNGKRTPVTNITPPVSASKMTGNIFFDSWVIMDDENPQKPGTTFEKLWKTNDLEQGKFTSLLNSGFIDDIADRALAVGTGDFPASVAQLPGYVSRQLEVLVSHAMLTGIPLEVPFYNRPYAQPGGKGQVREGIPTHTTFEHFFVSHFRLNESTAVDQDHYLWLNPYDPESTAAMKRACKSTSAFPVGLAYREFKPGHFKRPYVENIIRRIVSGHFGRPNAMDPDQDISFGHLPQQPASLTVDGGAVNNEPYAEVLSVLRDRYMITADAQYGQIGVVLIDAFPDRAKKPAPADPSEPAPQEPDFFDVAPKIIGMLWDQSKVKRNEMIAQFTHDHYRGQIYPSRHVRGADGAWAQKEPDPLACAAVGAFSGFLDQELRKHDFFLGRNNARNYVRAYLSLAYDPQNGIVHPIHKNWKPEMIEAFKIQLDKQTFLPIIPDMNILLGKVKTAQAEMGNYDIPKKPHYDPEPLFALRPAMEARLERIFEVAGLRFLKPAPPKKASDTERWLDAHYRSSWWGRIKERVGAWVLGIVLKQGKGSVATRTVKMAIETVLADLDKRELLKPYGSK